MRALVIGSGITGMSAALFLRRQGHEVRILEQCGVPSPLLRGFTRDGLFFDTGFHFTGGLGPNGILTRWLKALGVALPPGEVLPCRERMLCVGEYFELPSDFLSNPALFCSGSDEAHALRRIAEALRVELDKSPFTNPNCLELPELGDALVARQKTVSEMLGAFSGPLRHFLEAHCTLYGVPAKKAAWKDFAMVAGDYLQGSFMLRQGARTLLRAFYQAMHEAGVFIETNARVIRLETENNNSFVAAGLHNGQRIEADCCVYTGHPAHLKTLLPPGSLRPAFTRRVDALEDTPQPFLLFAETDSDALDGQVLYLLPSDGQAFAGVESKVPGIFLSAGSPVGKRRPVSCVCMTLRNDLNDKTVPQPSYDEWKAETVRRISERVVREIPELAEHFRVIDTATGLTYRHFLPGSTGSLYGLAHTADSLPLLPVTRVKGVTLAGQHILLPGILGGIISAAIASGILCGGTDVMLKYFRMEP